MEFWGYISHRTAFGQLSIKSPIGCSFVFYIDNAPLAATLSMKIFFFYWGSSEKTQTLKLWSLKKIKFFSNFSPFSSIWTECQNWPIWLGFQEVSRQTRMDLIPPDTVVYHGKIKWLGNFGLFKFHTHFWSVLE